MKGHDSATNNTQVGGSNGDRACAKLIDDGCLQEAHMGKEARLALDGVWHNGGNAN